MNRYILSRHTNPISESFPTLDDALQACLDDTPADGLRSFSIQVIDWNGMHRNEYSVRVAGTEITITIK